MLVLLVLAPGAGAQAATSTPAGTDGPHATTAATDLRPTVTDSTEATDAEDDACEALTGGEQRENPAEDTLGWENGCWYDDTITVDRSDGLNETELAAVVARAMARVEQVRELEFKKTVPVEVITRAEFRNETDDLNLTTNGRIHQNVKWEAMLMVNESTDAVAVKQSNRGSTVGGYYSSSEERIVVVSENTTSPKMDELTLAHELAHALQDQQFNLSTYNQSTEELNNAKSGIVEGDSHYTEHLYQQRCTQEWDCVEPLPSNGDGGGSDIHVGQFIVSYTPYSEGPEFVRSIRNDSGWAGVNAVFQDPPASTEQIIHHEKYGEDEPTQVSIENRSSNGWRVLPLEDGIDYAQFGEAGIFSMLWYASFQKSVEQQSAATVVIPYRDFFEYKRAGSNELEDVGPYSYAHEASDGWDGDTLLPYVNDSSAATNETGYVWKIAWDSEADAREFVEAYGTLLEYRGAEAVDDRRNTYRISDGTEFADAFYVEQDGTTVVIVNAPTVGALGDVRSGAAPETTATPTTDTDEDTPVPTETSTPGFGLLVAVLAGLVAALLVWRR
jgi:hypothetical protein